MRQPQPPRPLYRGYSLVELMVAIAIVSILIGVAVPSYRNATLNSRLAAISNGLVASARLARAEAFKRNQTVRLCASTDSLTCSNSQSWHTGWVVIVVSDGTLLSSQPAVASGFHVNAGAGSYDFSPRGFGTASGSLTVCRNAPSAGSSERVITIDGTGRTWLQKTTTGSCS